MSASLLPPRRPSTLDDRLIPLINIVFLLLIFFLIAGQITQQQNARIQAPASVVEPTLRNPSWLLEVDASKALRLNGEPVALDGLSAQLQDQPAERGLSIKLDRSLRASDLDAVLHAVRDGGARQVTLLTAPRQASGE